MKAGFIDIGSNSIRFMTGEKIAGQYSFSEKQVYTTRLAQGLLETGRLSPAAIALSLQVIDGLADACRARSLPVYAYATSAVRDALNREAFTEPAEKLLDRRIDVLSGEEEARNAYLATTGGSGGLIDIGGGSSQVIAKGYAHSFPMGCVRARDLAPKGTFSQIRAALKDPFEKLYVLPNLPIGPWYGVGGTITTLAACCIGLTDYNRTLVQGYLLHIDKLDAMLNILSLLGDRRQEHPLLIKRHDVILQGGAILLYLMEKIGIPELTVSDRDGLEGYAVQILDSIQ